MDMLSLLFWLILLLFITLVCWKIFDRLRFKNLGFIFAISHAIFISIFALWIYVYRLNELYILKWLLLSIIDFPISCMFLYVTPLVYGILPNAFPEATKSVIVFYILFVFFGTLQYYIIGRAVDFVIVEYKKNKIIESRQNFSKLILAKILFFIFVGYLGILSIIVPTYLNSSIIKYDSPVFPLIRTGIEGFSMLTVVSLVISGIIIGLIKPKYFWLWGFSIIWLLPTIAIIEMIKDPYSHNIWPIEFMFYGSAALLGVLGALIGKYIRRVFDYLKQRRLIEK